MAISIIRPSLKHTYTSTTITIYILYKLAILNGRVYNNNNRVGIHFVSIKQMRHFFFFFFMLGQVSISNENWW